MSAAEAPPLLQLDRDLRLLGGEGEFRLIPARAGGGACHFLRANRCRAHDRRPFPCREFPVSVHLGNRAQGTLVLSCPGLALRGTGPRAGGGAVSPAIGLDLEIETAERELREAPLERLASAQRRWSRALERAGVATAEELENARKVARRSLAPPDADLLAGSLPPLVAEGFVHLPLFFDARFGRLALGLSDDESRVEAIPVPENGEPPEPVASLAPVTATPRMTPEGAAMLTWYRDQLLQRDAVLGAVLESHRPRELASVWAAEVEADLGHVLARAVWRAQLRGDSGQTLGAEELLDGIRATDAEVHDRPTVGAVL